MQNLCVTALQKFMHKDVHLFQFWHTCVQNTTWTHHCSFFVKLISSFNHSKIAKLLAFKSIKPLSYTLPKKLHRVTFHQLSFFFLRLFLSYYSCNFCPIHIFTFLLGNVIFHKPNMLKGANNDFLWTFLIRIPMSY
jgi:hypothetical protein